MNATNLCNLTLKLLLMILSRHLNCEFLNVLVEVIHDDERLHYDVCLIDRVR